MRLCAIVILAAAGATCTPLQQQQQQKRSQQQRQQHSTALTIPQRLLAGGTGRTVGQLVMYPADALRTLAQTRAGARSLGELGAQTLISGAATTSLFAYLIGAVQFAIYGTVAPQLGTLAASVCGAIGSCIVSVPQEVVKQRLVTGIYPNFAAAVSHIWRNEGLRGFYTAWLPTVSRNVPFVVTTFVTFAWLEARSLNSQMLDDLLCQLPKDKFG